MLLKKKIYIIGIIFICLGILIDQLVKIIIRNNMDVGRSIELIRNFFSITHVENTGAAWGGFSGYTIVLTIISIVILGYFIYIYKNLDFKNKKVFSISIVMVISGTIGNLIDRLFFQSVTDFLDFNILGYDFPVFNIADILLVIGFALFLIDMIFLSDEVKAVKELDNEDIIEEDKENIEEKELEENINEEEETEMSDTDEGSN